LASDEESAMSIDLSFQEQSNFLLVVISGQYDPVVVRETLEAIKERATQTNAIRILIDAFDLSAPTAEFARYMAGLAFAELFPYPFRVAVLYKRELINKFAENTAVNRGASFHVCSDKDYAIRWLLDELADNATDSDEEAPIASRESL
jgi:hypothetical protein